MADREKVIDGLEHCRRGPIGCQQECPYKSDFGCRSQLTADVLELLKEQEAVVLCKDCKYCEYPKAEKEWCKKGHLYRNGEKWFCADGERR